LMGHSLGSTRMWGSWRLALYPERPVQTAHCCPQIALIKGVLAFCFRNRGWSPLGRTIPLFAQLTGIPAVAGSHNRQGSRGCFIINQADPLGGSTLAMKLASPTWHRADPRRECQGIEPTATPLDRARINGCEIASGRSGDRNQIARGPFSSSCPRASRAGRPGVAQS
jgi:hypothetical protein